MKKTIESLLRQALDALPEELLPAAARRDISIEIERTRDAAHGDFATNLAMRLAKSARKNPRALAEALRSALPPAPSIAKVEIAGAGFINFFLTDDAYHAELGQVLEQGERYGRSTSGQGRKVLVEFVSANPTGPLHVGHGRHAAYGATLANLLEATGHAVTREYYINDAGRQMDILAVSVWLRYLAVLGERFDFPANGYRGDYITPIAEKLREAEGERLRHAAAAVFAGMPPDEPQGGNKDTYIDAVIARARQLLGAEPFRKVLQFGLDAMLADIRDDLTAFGAVFDRWYSEHSLSESGAIDEAFKRLERQGHTYRKDGALWFRATAFGDDEDRVVERENGARTYFASDIAYHLDKRMRGFEHLIDVLGADHHGYVSRVRGGLAAMGEPPESLEVVLIQLVSLYRGGVKVAMGKRDGNFVTLRQLREEVGNDAARLFYVMRSNDQHLDFDLELAKSRSNDNPVYYLQYAHARVASVLKQAADRGIRIDLGAARAHLARLITPEERRLTKRIAEYPEIVASAASLRAPHLLVHFLRDLANDFHTNYSAHVFLVDDAALRDARLALAVAAQIVLRNGLKLLGVQAPETM